MKSWDTSPPATMDHVDRLMLPGSLQVTNAAAALHTHDIEISPLLAARPLPSETGVI